MADSYSHPQNIFQSKQNLYRKAFEKFTQRSKVLSLVRIIHFAISIVFIIYLANERLQIESGVFAVFSVIVFLGILKYHNKIQYLEAYYAALVKINEDELSRLSFQLVDFEEGKDFVNHEHPYTSDLAIFGEYSLFQLLNRTNTQVGKMKLADWLSNPLSKRTIHNHQVSVKELAEKIDWRQSFQAKGHVHKVKKLNYVNDLIEWTKAPSLLSKAMCLKLSVIQLVMAVLSFFSLFYFIANSYEVLLSEDYKILLQFSTPVLVCLLVNTILNWSFQKKIIELVKKTKHDSNELRGVESLLASIEKEDFVHKRLKEFQHILKKDRLHPAKEIKKLRESLDFLDTGHSSLANYFYPILNSLFLLDIFLLIRLEGWKDRNTVFFGGWVEAVGYFEALSSLAAFSYSHPKYTFPKIIDESGTISFKNLGHPLIEPDTRVCNDISIKSDDIILVTGSNMAGKSTFLRTVGINMVLGLMGAPVCAKEAELPFLHVFSSMQTQDNLSQGKSSFYAELLRLRQLLELIEKSEEPVFFLLDEILKGTNSEDRHTGAVSLIKQLGKLNAHGLISTHDLAIGKLAEQDNAGYIQNYSFNSHVEDGDLKFDYKLTAGVCKEKNA
ncbi:MAG: DNA mismatch repair protein MutS, partial [Bacteroidota bacterium]